MTRDAENWDELQALFHLAEETPEAELDGVLERACKDESLRARAKALVLASRVDVAVTTSRVGTLPGGRIGPYRVLRHLGSGGIGAVYLGERIVGGTVQRVALKVLSPHAAGPFFTDRFAREQHILASLEHPNITRMLDAGMSEGGQPYLVMEYVDGVHLDVFCDDRNLGVQERLQLFLKVCDAVAYAHRNLVVHLDLKPSNILVAKVEETGARGTVKLLDFGTSKLIEPDSRLTTTVMATPAYASPEQLRNEPVTTACDVYALGAILFELLAGRRPNQDSSVAVMIERSMREMAPEPLAGAVTEGAAEHRGLTQARLKSELSGDLGTIVAKCLTPRPKDRYASVDALMTDVQRYMGGRPILARPQTTTYRLGKFIRRNRKPVVASVLASVALVAMAGYALWRQEQAVRAGARAMQMQSFMYRLFRLANSNTMGKPAATVPEFLQLGVKVLPAFITDAADQRAAQMSLAESMFENDDYAHAEPVFERVIAEAKAAGDVGSLAEAEGFAGKIAYTLGRADEGKPLAEEALALSHKQGVSATARVYIEVFYAENLENEGYRTDENVRLLRAAVEESQKRHVPDHELAYATMALAGALGPRGQLDEQERLTQETIAIYGREPYALCDQADAYEDLALIENQRKNTAGSLAMARKAYEGFKACSGEGSRNALSAQGFLAAAMLRAGQQKAVIPMLEASLPAWRKAVGPDSDELANPLLFLTRAYLADGDDAKAEATAAELVRVEQGKVKPLSAQMGVCQAAWAEALAGQGRYREALGHAEMADAGFAAEGSKAPGTMRNAEKAHALLEEIRAKLAAAGGVGKK